MSDSKNKSPYQRMRRDFIKNEPGARSDEATLELLLAYALGHKDVRPVAEELLDKYGNLPAVLAASKKELEQIQGVGEATVALFKIIDFLRSEPKPSVAEHPSSASPPDVGSASPLPDSVTAPDESSILMREEEPVSPMAGSGQGDAEHLSDSSREPKKEPLPGDLVGCLLGSLSEDVPRPSSPCRLETIDVPDSSTDTLTPALSLQGEGGTRQALADLHPVQATLWAPKKPLQQGQTKRKLQLSNSYMLEFDQLARVLNFLLENKEVKKISRNDLQEETGLAVRQIASLVSMGSAMGLIQPASQILTPTGRLIADNDIFIENKGTLEWCHYVGAGSFSNLVWFEVFNHLLTKDSPMTMKEWTDSLRRDLAGQYSEATLKKHLQKEVRFVVDAYFERNFRKLELFHQGPKEVLYLRRYLTFEPLVLSAMMYDFCERRQARLFQVDELAGSPGSPAVLFGLDIGTFRNLVEGLHERGLLRYETTHNLDQIRLKPFFSAYEFLSAHFEGRTPRE